MSVADGVQSSPASERSEARPNGRRPVRARPRRPRGAAEGIAVSDIEFRSDAVVTMEGSDGGD